MEVYFPFSSTVDPRLSKPQLSEHLDYPNAKSYCSIRVFVTSVHSIRVNDCSIRVALYINQRASLI